MADELEKDTWTLPKMLWNMRKPKKSTQETNEQVGLESLQTFRLAAITSLIVGFAATYNASIWVIENYIYPAKLKN